MGKDVADSADGTLQTIGYAYNWWRIFLLVLSAVGLIAGGAYLQTEYRKGYTQSTYIATGVKCGEEHDCNNSSKTGRRVCRDCTVTGEFGALDRTYGNGAEPPAEGDEVVVFEAPNGDLTLDPGVPKWLPTALYVGGGVCLVGAVILFALRNSKWFRRAQGVNLGLSIAGR